jgi:hypothetical protein
LGDQRKFQPPLVGLGDLSRNLVPQFLLGGCLFVKFWHRQPPMLDFDILGSHRDRSATLMSINSFPYHERSR